MIKLFVDNENQTTTSSSSPSG